MSKNSARITSRKTANCWTRWHSLTNRLVIVVCTAIVLGLGSEAVAGPDFELSGALGGHVPLGAFADAADVGTLLGANLGIGISPTSFFGMTYDYHRNSASDAYRKQIGLVGDDSAQFASWSAMLYFKQLLRDEGWNPYLKLQGGVSHLELQLPEETIVSTGSHFSLGGGLGLQNELGTRYAYFAEVLLHRIFVDDSIPDNLEEGQLRSFASLRIGLTLLVR